LAELLHARARPHAAVALKAAALRFHSDNLSMAFLEHRWGP
jgi:hypothetical protein